MFNIYVADLPAEIQIPSLQYADDTALTKSCPKPTLFQALKEIETDLTNGPEFIQLLFKLQTQQKQALYEPMAKTGGRLPSIHQAEVIILSHV